MKKYRIFIGILLAVWGLASCGKDNNFPSTPDLKFQSIYFDKDSNRVVITCSFKDKEGDIQGTIWFKTYQITPGGTNEGVFGQYPVPDFPSQNNMEGDIILILKQIDFTGVSPGDSLYFDLYLKDKAEHVSD